MKPPLAIDFLIDLALDCRDFEKLKELSEAKYNLNNKAFVTEDIRSEYGILINGQIYDIKEISELELIHKVMVKCKKFRPRKGDVIEYEILNLYDRFFTYGYFVAKSQSNFGGFWWN